jgi:LacI family transcriptional regulator
MVTIKDVAKEAGVSIATVSYVLNNDPRIKKETTEKVMKAAKKLNYIASGIARSLKKSKTNIIIVFVSNFAGPIYQEILENLHHILKSLGYKMIVCNGDLAESFLLERQSDGAIILDTNISMDLLIKATNFNYPIVDTTHSSKIETILAMPINSFDSSYEIIKQAITENYTKIGFMHGNTKSLDNSQRYGGYLKALEEGNLKPFCILQGNFTEASGYDEMKRYVKEGNTLPEVLFCSNDEMAVGAMEYLQKHNIIVGQQIKMIGFDNIELSKFCKPPLTTIDIDRIDWTENIARNIVNLVEGKKAIEYNTKATIIRRESF